jgi:hypothetical protein
MACPMRLRWRKVTRIGEAIDKPEDLKGKRFVYSRPKSVSESIIFAIPKSFKIPPGNAVLLAVDRRLHRGAQAMDKP